MIEVGEYCRTKNGLIFKVDTEKKNLDINEFLNMGGNRDIIKHSKDIIDLIEVSDYVNGYLIVDKWYDYANKCYHLVTEGNKHIFEEDIKTILTHEQYEQNCYKIGE